MVKYSSFLLIASIWLFTVLCVSAQSVSANGGQVKKFEDKFMGIVKTAFKQFEDISTSSSSVVRLIREEANEYLKSFDDDKKEIQDAVTEGTKLEKKIQSVLTSLKNSTKPLPNELQSEVDAIGKTVTAEITKLKGMSNVADISGVQKDIEKQYANIRGKIQELFTEAVKVVPETTEQKITDDSVGKVKTKLLEVIKAVIPLGGTTKKGAETVSNKMKTTYNALSEIRNGLDKVEQIQYNLLLLQNKFQTDIAPSVRSPMVQFAIAIMLGMFFESF